ncbi:MAG: tetratricopeptide repeat protein [Rhodospirillales bacterium]|jgi:tetratricopeptide (TPR) repeat protein|nr:tetratricopeptide repeat protein [Rhodospirillales bacterium]MDP7215463.1 tetratricopeptide repeat protein [Rhodospirillales bacterium]HIJ43518.1 tetratricopeptide repeat protein [Rhodospirillaceae bacterium]HIJ93500.1 tetratricopeptide repeat protein [Rhodospirillaceae bacterium]
MADAIDGLVAEALEAHRAGDFDRAERNYKEYLDSKERSVDVIFLLGLVKLNKGEPENALGLFDEARQKEPGQAEYHAAAGDALMAMERAEEAEKAYRETIKLSAQTPEYMFRLGQALWAQGHRDKAEKTLIAGLSYDTDENQPEIRIALSKLLIEKAEHLLKQGLIDNAIREGFRAANLSPDHGEIKKATDAIINFKRKNHKLLTSIYKSNEHTFIDYSAISPEYLNSESITNIRFALLDGAGRFVRGLLAAGRENDVCLLAKRFDLSSEAVNILQAWLHCIPHSLVAKDVLGSILRQLESLEPGSLENKEREERVYCALRFVDLSPKPSIHFGWLSKYLEAMSEPDLKRLISRCRKEEAGFAIELAVRALGESENALELLRLWREEEPDDSGVELVRRYWEAKSTKRMETLEKTKGTKHARAFGYRLLAAAGESVGAHAAMAELSDRGTPPELTAHHRQRVKNLTLKSLMSSAPVLELKALPKWRSFLIAFRNSGRVTFDINEPDRSIVFVNAARSQGTAMNINFRKLFPKDRIWKPDPAFEIREFQKIGRKGLARKIQVSFHAAIRATPWFDNETGYFTMIRDPVRRFISAYYKRVREMHYEARRNDSLSNNVEKLPSNEFANFVVAFFESADEDCDDPVWGQNQNLNEGQLFDLAYEVLCEQFAFVGITELYNETLVAFSLAFGLNRVPLLGASWLNGENVFSPKDEDIAPRILEQIREKNAVDCELYRRFREKFETEFADVIDFTNAEFPMLTEEKVNELKAVVLEQ